jgi:putative flippase GtrA
MLLAMKDYGIAFDEVKIRTVYIEENKSSHFHAIKDSWRIYKLILKHFFRYTVSSIVSAVVDNGMFALLSGLLHNIFTGFPLTAVCTVSARVVSSLLNFFMNHRLVFQSKVSVKQAMLRYYMLAIPQMAAQVLLTQGAYSLLGISDSATGIRTLIYVAVMTVLYFLSYVIQQRWVFAPDQNQ